MVRSLRNPKKESSIALTQHSPTMNKQYWIRTISGRKFYPFAPTTDQIDINDIAHSLARQCRYAGHVPHFYSVAEHCVEVVNKMEYHPEMRPYALSGLLHDATEAYLCDLPKPLKQGLQDYQDLELLVEKVIEDKFGVDLGAAEVKAADNIVLQMECQRFFSKEHFTEYFGFEPKLRFKDRHYVGLFPEMAQLVFLETFLRLSK